MRAWVWISAVLAPVLLIGGWTLAQAVRPGPYDPVRDTISALAARGAPDRWVMTGALAGLGVVYLVSAAGMPAAGRVARSLLAVGGLATIGVAAAPQPSAGHAPSATVAFLALALWPAAVAAARFRRGRWITVVLLVLLVWFGVALHLNHLVGLSERVLAGAESLTPLAVAFGVGRPRRAGVPERRAAAGR